MSIDTNYKFYLRIVLPSVLAIALFIISIYVIIIPAFERNMLERKKEMISELTHAAWSVLDEYQQKVNSSGMSLDSAKAEAAEIIELMRYGSEGKDYFWIIDTRPVMIMHPYRPELNGTDLTHYKDPEGNLLFMEAVERVQESEEGFIEYIWQWKDDSTRMVPKLSYVKSYPQWNWIVGTGIYLEDVAREIASLKSRLRWISFLIILVISTMLFSIIRQSLRIEYERKEAERGLRLSRQKYKALVEASTEGTIMMIKQKIIFANLKISDMLGISSKDIPAMKFEELFDIEWSEVMSRFTDPNKSVALETRLKSEGQPPREVIISVSKVEYGHDDGFIVVAKDVTRQKRLEIESSSLIQELQLSLQLMNQSIKSLVKEGVLCDGGTTVREAATLMTRKKQSVVFITLNDKIIGSLDDEDLRSRVLAEKRPDSIQVLEVMTSPVVSIMDDALVYEALLLLKEKGVRQLLVKDIHGNNKGVLSQIDVLSIQQNSVDFTLHEIKLAEDVNSLVRINSRTPVLINALLEASDKMSNLTHIITSISDAITKRLIELIIEKMGNAPCSFTFVALGSEGRKEQTLSTDQDNAIIIPDMESEATQEALAYFSKFAFAVNTELNKIGYRFCKGEIMAMNPKWTQPLSVWKEYFTSWITSSDPQSILDSSIFFDLRCIYGDCNMVEQLASHIHDKVDHQAVFFQHMANPILRFKSRLSMFGSIVEDQASGESKMIDIKKIQLPITAFARLYSLKHKLWETNTLKRLEKLHATNIITRELYDELILSHSLLMKLRLRSQARAELNNLPPDNMVDITQLTNIEVSTLKKVLSELTHLQTKVSFDFKGGL